MERNAEEPHHVFKLKNNPLNDRDFTIEQHFRDFNIDQNNLDFTIDQNN